MYRTLGNISPTQASGCFFCEIRRQDGAHSDRSPSHHFGGCRSPGTASRGEIGRASEIRDVSQLPPSGARSREQSVVRLSAAFQLRAARRNGKAGMTSGISYRRTTRIGVTKSEIGGKYDALPAFQPCSRAAAMERPHLDLGCRLNAPRAVKRGIRSTVLQSATHARKYLILYKTEWPGGQKGKSSGITLSLPNRSPRCVQARA
jgi:hypothetical protein